MAKLVALPEQAIINGFKGTLDYYVWMGIPCCRSWPRARTVPITPQEKAQWQTFTDASQLWNTLDQATKNAYNKMASGSTMSGRDVMVKLYINSQSLLPY